jgi:FkbM family methyltransferase
MSTKELDPPKPPEFYIYKSGAKVGMSKILVPDFVSSIKIDVGLSGNAPQSKMWIDANPNTLVFGFEPLSMNIKMISEATSTWPIKLDPRNIGRNIYIIPVALSSKTLGHKLKMKITDEESGSSSLLDSTYLLQSTWEYVPVFKLDDFIDFIDLERFKFVEYLKIDAQGMDFEVIRGAKKYLSKICFITAEMDLTFYGTKNNSLKLNCFMTLRGFLKLGKITTYFLRRVLKLKINVDDDTYINLRLLHKINKSFFIYQKG